MRRNWGVALLAFGLGGACVFGGCVDEVPVPAEGEGEGEGEGEPFVTWRTVARRLSVSELDNTLRDVFGDDTRPASRLLSEDEFSPFDNEYDKQQTSQALVDSLEILAEDVAVRVTEPARRDALVGCTPADDGDAACFRSFVAAVGERALRRPLSAEEIDRYLPLLAYATEDNPDVENDFYTAVQLAVRAFILDPEFLFRVEVGTAREPGVFALDDYEIASRMSYLLWGSAPDRALLDEAADGALTDPARRRAAAARLMADARARDQLHRFHAMWLGYRAIPHPPELTAAFNRETNALLDRVIFDEERSYLDLFRLEETFVDDALADHYGLPRPAGGEGWVSYEGTERAGILGHGAVLAGFSKFNDTSPTQRGIFVRERLLCAEIQPPPPTVDVDQPPEGDPDACKIERYQAHMGSGSCNACHATMDPIGFGLENYDVAGRFRTHDDGRPECVIDIDGEVPGVGAFRGPAELSGLLIESELVQACAVTQFATFAIGRKPSPEEAVEVSRLTDAFAGVDHSFEELLLAFVESEAFALRKEEEVQ